MMTIGVLGGGQLGRMLALAGYPLGLTFRFLDPAPEAPAEPLADFIVGDYRDVNCLARFVQGVDLVTYEFENVPVDVALALQRTVPVYPPSAALEASQDRLTEKTLFRELGLQTAPFEPVGTRGDLQRAAARLGYPAILKTRRFGYDGKGQFFLGGPADLDRAYLALGGVPLILEGFVAFDREVSQIAARGRDGEVVFYPLVENHHAGGILRLSLAPAPGLTDDLQRQGESLARRVLERLDYRGVLAIEFFQVAGGLVANEMAPRVHNSGHWTIEGAETSQFENHVRAILGWPLGPTAIDCPCAMVNLIGTVPEVPALLATPGTHLHLYGKAPRPGRKLGHVTVRAATVELLRERIAAVERVIERPPAQGS
jgi:5-(carboxyamino)imidazole ribonucleotide synthase